MKQFFNYLFSGILIFTGGYSYGQTPVYPNPLIGICDAPVPHFNIDLTGTPDSVWVSPNVSRQETCCTDPGTGNWTFVSFTVTLDPNVAEVAVGLSPSDPGGTSSGYWIDVCGTWSDRIEGGQEVCITGPGTHNFWYGKSGGNANSAYTIVQIPKPTFPQDDSVRIGCQLPIDIYGLSNITITSGDATYDSWLDMTDPSHPIYTPGSTAPPFIDYTISGNQIASASCGSYTTTDIFRVYNFQPLDVDVTPDPANFCEGGSVVLTATVNNGVGTEEFSWIDNSTNIEISTVNFTPAISTEGNYTVYISDDLTRYGCPPFGITRFVTETLAPTVDAGEDDTVCVTSPVALLAATVSNSYSGVLWTSPTGGTFDDATILAPTYTASAADLIAGQVDLTVTVTGCQVVSDIVTIYFDSGPVYTVATPTLNCADETGTASVNITSGGTAPWTPISYYWSYNGVSGPSMATLGAGTYSVTVVNQYGCGSNTPFTITAPPALTLVMSNTDATPTGTATGTVGGGTTAYSYNWENSAGAFMGNTSTIVGLLTDYYVLTVTDANGCEIIGSTVVNAPFCAGFNATASGTDVTCYDGIDGSATVTGTGGAGSVGPYAYSWIVFPSQTTITATGLSAGVYEVIVTDLALNCRDVAIAVVGEPAQLANTMTHTDNIIIGGTTGTATANPSGGTSPYTYTWTTMPVQNTQTATNLAAGAYAVTIEDDNSCALTDNVIVNEPPCNNFQAVVNVTDISCNGETDGEASVIVVHGTAPYTYALDGGAYLPNPSGDFSGLSGGVHSLSIMDQSNCVVIQNFSVNEPSLLSIGLNPQNMTCYGVPNGTIDLSVSGGTYPYTFSWVNNNGNLLFATTEDVIELGASTYSVTVTDARGCTVQSSAGINQPDKLGSTYVVSEINCYNSDNGSIDVTVSGGQPPYSYSWVFPGGSSTIEDLTNLSPGQYILEVTDANLCSVEHLVDYYMNEPNEVEIVSYIVNCPIPGDVTTLVEIDTITGGTEGPYQLSFDGGAFLGSGIYTTSLSVNTTHTVTAMDGNGCTVSVPTSIAINPVVSISSLTFDPCIPAAATNINITVTPAGGDGGLYEVSTDNGVSYNAAGTYIISVPVNATYNVVVKDGLGCESLPTSVLIPGELTTSFIADSVTCLNGNDGSILMNVSQGTSPYNVSWTGPSSGNPAGNEIASSGGNYTISSLTAGVYTITITDANACTKISNVTVGTVVDLIDPQISCPSNSTLNNDAGLCSAVVNYGTPVGTDNCLGSITTQTAGLATGATFAVGTTTNTFLVTDAQGRTATCSFDITIIDNEDPVITCPVDVTVTADAGSCGALNASVNLGVPVTSDNCNVLSVVNDSPANYLVGTTIVTWTVTDIHGNTSTCQQTVTITDDEDPTITCAADIAVDSDAGNCYALVTLTNPTVGDNCTILSVVNDAPATFPVGTTTVTWTVTDVNGNSATCTQDVVVTDNEDPFILCAADVAVNNSAGLCDSAVVLIAPITDDNCGVLSVVNDAPATFPVGTTTVTWTVTDIHGNTSICTQDVVVTDNEDPTITCPADVSVTADAGSCGALNASVNLGVPVTSDNCNVLSVVNDSPANYLVGTTIVTWTVTDIHGNTSTCQQTVTITDDEDPTITCAADVAVDSDAGNCYALVTLTNPTTGDNCTILSVVNDAPATFPVGTTTVTWTVTDVNGNSATCTQDVVVTDNEDPFILCAADVAVNNSPGLCDSAVVLIAPITDDNCGVLSVVNDAPATFPVGTTTVTWTVTDIHGNTSTCTQDVVVTDNEDPIVTCAADVSVSNDAGLCDAVVVLTAPTVTDNCGIATIVNDAPATFVVGTTLVTWTITDVNGNVVTCTQNVTVTDNELPVVTCSADVTVSNDAGICAAVVVLTQPTVSDNCGVSTIVNDAPATFPVGTTTVTWTVTDIHGNSITCAQNVTVVDDELPVVVTCPSDTSSCFPELFFDAPVATDNCGVASTLQTSGLASGTIFPVGITNQIFEFTDVNGNVNTCSFSVTIFPVPVATNTYTDVTCYGANDGSIDLTVTTGTSPYVFDWSNGETTEDISSLAPGIYDVQITDFNGCETADTVTISQTDTLAISVIASDVTCDGLSDGSIDITPSGGLAPYTFNWSNGSGSEDISGLIADTYDLTMTDVNNCTFDLSVVISQPDTITASATTLEATCLSADGLIDLTVGGGVAPYTYLWDNSMTTQDIDSVVAGNYSVTITDFNGCEFVYADSILSVNPLSANATIEDVLCYGDRNGSIVLEVIHGDAPITYLWSTGDTTNAIFNVLAGDYSVTITDSNFCQLDLIYTIIQPDSLYLEMTSPLNTYGYNIGMYGGEDGEIDLTVTGGISPYEYLWSNTAVTEDIFNLTAGTYSVLVTDDNGCTIQGSIVLTEPLMLEMPTGYSPNDDGSNDFFVIHGLDAFPGNEIEIFNRWGNVVYSMTNYDNSWNGTNSSGVELPDGTYFVILKVTNIDEPITGYVDLRRKH